ncbi:MAG: transketolase [Candidatus Undinarchaeales archaeon]|jgi:transketolase|nr:transketolase [Candidatus Undinarchaeales archaeon]
MKKYTVEELEKAANEMRAYMLVALHAAGSGHSGGSLSCMDLVAGAYLNAMNHDPKNPNMEDRDRFLFSAGHKAPALYTALGYSGYFDIKEMMKLRKLESKFQGHPHWLKLEGVEASTGSLGQGLSIAVGMALAGKLNKKDHRIYCLMGDGEQQEGQVWEAVMEAAHYKLDNLTAIVDVNNLQIDGNVSDVMNIQPLKEKYEGFSWNVIELDGHNMQQIVDGYGKAKTVVDKPTVILAKTIKGKGVSYMEDQAGWHGKAPNREELETALKELGVELPIDELLKIAQDYQKEIDKKVDGMIPKFSKNYWWNEQDNMKAEMKPTRKGFGECLIDIGDDERIICLGADISGSICINQFNKDKPERNPRFLSMGIAEQSGTAVAAGLAKEGKIPIFGTYAVFSAGRALDQIRTTICYGNFNVKITGAHGGVSVGPDGATHQALEDIFQMCGLPNMNVFVPCDSVETKKASKTMILDIEGPCYIRYARESTPIVTTDSTPYKFGTANIIRYREAKDNFIDAFETKLASDYKSENEDLTIVACGPEVPEAMRAAWILKEEFGLETRIINMHTLKPLDNNALSSAGKETKIILTAEEHQKGGLGNRVAAALLEAGVAPEKFAMIGVPDRFGESGGSWELVKYFALSAEFIAQKAKELAGK